MNIVKKEIYRYISISEVFTINWKIQFFTILKNYHIIKEKILNQVK